MGFWKSSREEFVNRRRSPQRDHLLLVTARVDAKRQEQMRRVGALATLAGVAGVAIWAAASGSQALAATFFQKNPRFEISQLDLKSTGRLKPEHLRHYAGLEEGSNLFAVDLGQVRKKLLEQPLISEVEITRTLPDTLSIRVTERIALARVEQPGLPPLPVDREGHLMSPPAPPTLPIISGLAERGLSPGGLLHQAAARDALALLDAHESARLAQVVPIASVDVGDPTQIVIVLKNGARVQVGRTELVRRLNRLAEIIARGDERDEELVTADLTVDRNEPAVYRPRGQTPPPQPARAAPAPVRPRPPATAPARPRSTRG